MLSVTRIFGHAIYSGRMQTEMLQKYNSRMTQTLRQLGHDPEVLFAREGWNPTRLSQLTGPQLQREQYKMIRVAIVESGREDLGVLVGGNMNLLDFGSLGMLVASSSTGRVAFRRVFHFLSIAEILWSATYDLDSDDPYFAISFHEAVPKDLQEYFLDEFASAWNQFSRDVMGVDHWAQAFHLPFPETADRNARSKLLNIPFRFDQAGYRFDLSVEMLNARLADANPVIAAMLEQQCELIVQGMPNAQAEVEKIRRIVLDRLPEIPSVTEIARALNTSERSLRRICARNDTTARDIILDVRLATACNHLRNSTMTVNEISYLVGYSSPSSFFHAFRNWAGVSPSEFRQSEADFAAKT